MSDTKDLEQENILLKKRIEQLESRYVSNFIYIIGPYGKNALCPCDKCKTMYENYYKADKEKQA